MALAPFRPVLPAITAHHLTSLPCAVRADAMGCGGSKAEEAKVQVPEPRPAVSAGSAGRAGGDALRAQDQVNVDVADKTKGGDKRRAGVSAETAADAARSSTYKPGTNAEEKSDEQRDIIARATADSTLFAGLSDAQREEVVSVMFQKKFNAGDTVITQGDVGDNFYVVDSGEFKAYLKQAGDKAVKTYNTGGTFGELALMYNCPRAATVMCTQAGAVWGLDRATFRHILFTANKESIETTASVRTCVHCPQAHAASMRCAAARARTPLRAPASAGQQNGLSAAHGSTSETGGAAAPPPPLLPPAR